MTEKEFVDLIFTGFSNAESACIDCDTKNRNKNSIWSAVSALYGLPGVSDSAMPVCLVSGILGVSGMPAVSGVWHTWYVWYACCVWCLVYLVCLLSEVCSLSPTSKQI